MAKVSIRELVNGIIRSASLKERTRIAAEKLRDQINDDYMVISVGKASQEMLAGLIEGLGSRPSRGLVILPKGYRLYINAMYSNLSVIQSGHPIPDQESLDAGEAALNIAKSAGGLHKALVVLVSGGGSALMEKPLPGVSLQDIATVNSLLLRSGASISEINTVRRHLSQVKGGGLVKVSRGAEVYGIYASDVPGDKLEDIASGPTAPDPTTFSDALEVLRTYDIIDKVPTSVINALQDGLRGRLPETLKPGSPELDHVNNFIIAKNLDVLLYVKEALEKAGFNVMVLTSAMLGESREVGKLLASIAYESVHSGLPLRPPAAIIMGGETNVTVKGRGLGGRNQELALSWVIEAHRLGLGDEVHLLALATDGVDGPTNAAGAFVTPRPYDALLQRSINPIYALKDNNSYAALKP